MIADAEKLAPPGESVGNAGQAIAEQIVYVGRTMFEQRLTDFAGGNISVRDGDTIYISPRYAGSKQHWKLEPSDILSGAIANDDILAHPRFSREGKMHLAVYRTFPDAGAIIHAHPFHILPFVVANRPIEPVLEATQKFGVTELVPAAPAHSDALAHNVVEGMRGKDDRIRKQAVAVLIPYRGIVVAGKDLYNTLDALERIDWNAWCILAAKQLTS
ncbi:MAG: class II aldolase/adducin family protein [Anaerolineales bacterium]|nr:class II aldolase/adducin family protein [Anaerolineales bacterium]